MPYWNEFKSDVETPKNRLLLLITQPSGTPEGQEMDIHDVVVGHWSSPVPGFGEKYWSLFGFPSHSFESGGGTLLTVIFGQIFAYSAFSDSHFSSPGSVSGLIASTGHSGTQTPQSMHSSGWMTSMFSPS
jgi:hypothetical protein